MEQQRIFKARLIENLISGVKEGSAISKFKSKEFVYTKEEDTLIKPRIERPLGLLTRLDPKKDFESALELYKAFENLTPLEAADSRFWTYLALVDLYPYMLQRWSKVYDDTAENPKAYLLEHFILESSSGLLRHQLSGLWWSVYLSIDKERDDPFELTKVLFWNQTLRTRTMGTYLISRHKEALLGFLEYCLEKGKDNFGNFEKEHQELSSYLNLLGGVKPLSYFNRNQVKNFLLEKFSLVDNDDGQESITSSFTFKED